MGWLYRVLFLAALVPLTSGCQKSQEKSDSLARSSVESQSQRIPYAVFLEWGIPNGGHGKVIVIDPQYRNEKDLRTLGETLRNDTRQDRNAFVFILDDSVAAAMYQNLANLNEKDGAFYDQHNVGSYTRNVNTGFHRLEVSLSGPYKSPMHVDY